MKPIKYYKKTMNYSDENEAYNQREAFVLITDEVALEAWRMPSNDRLLDIHPTGYFGGIERHSPTPLYEGHNPTPGRCELVKGGTCYHDGSSMAFDEVQYIFNRPAEMYAELEDRYEAMGGTVTNE